MNAPKMHELSAPNDDFLADLERFSVPFGVEIKGHYISTPPSVWSRVFNGPHDESGRPIRRGGIPAYAATIMRKEADRLTAKCAGLGRAHEPAAALCDFPSGSGFPAGTAGEPDSATGLCPATTAGAAS
ncbi:MAG TPA: hypothetical protein PKV98_07735, partial [Burkholderiaceae bacterium]|nr:hypothetical protein [Burkholderiaceae bacterium]